LMIGAESLMVFLIGRWNDWILFVKLTDLLKQLGLHR
jgi:hypothetical protein